MATRLKHTYATLVQVFKSAEVDYGEMSGWDFSEYSGDISTKTGDEVDKFARTYMLPYMAGAYMTPQKLTYQQFGYKQGIYNPIKKTYGNISPTHFIRLNNGAVISLLLNKIVESNIVSNIALRIDIDGISGYNTWGKDVFVIEIYLATGEVVLRGKYLNVNSATGKPTNKAQNRDDLIKKCKEKADSCAALIQYDNWTFQPDYPWF